MSEPSRERLQSLDVFRGFDMMFIMGVAGLVCQLCALFGFGKGFWLVEQMHHPSWDGLTHHDTIFPTFLFIAGVSWPWSLAKQRERGRTTAQIALRCVRRGAVLFLLGLVFNGLLKWQPDQLVWGSVLGRIGIAWAAAALLYLAFSTRTRIAIAVSILLGYWALICFVPAPDAATVVIPSGYEMWGRGPFSPAGNLSAYLDRMILPGKLTIDKFFSNQGTLSTFPAVVTAMLGMFTGEFLRSKKDALSGNRRALRMFLAALGLLAAGLFVAYGCGPYSMPINKLMWSTSFVLVVGSYSLGLFSLFYWLVDVKGWRSWAFFFTVIGMNSITIYLGQRIISFSAASNFFLGGLCAKMSPAWSGVVSSIGYIAVCWLFLWFLYRKNVFLRV